MLTRALMLNPLPLQAPAQRVLGRYLTKNQAMIDVTWDQNAKRLYLNWTGKASYSEVYTAVSSQGRAAYLMSDGRMGLYDVTATGLAPSPAAVFNIPRSTVGPLSAVNGNGDALFIKGSNPPTWHVVNGITGHSSITYGANNFGGENKTYNTGDGWIVETVGPVIGDGNVYPWTIASNYTYLEVAYPYSQGQIPRLATVGSSRGGSVPLPFSGVPSVLPVANTINITSVYIYPSTSGGRFFALNQIGGGRIAIPATATVEEVNIEQGSDAYFVAYSKSRWSGYVSASMASSVFLPLAVQYETISGVPCDLIIPETGPQEGRRLYYPKAGYSLVGAGGGIGSPIVSAILPNAVYMEGITVDPRSATLIANPARFNRSLVFALPHLGALVGYGSQNQNIKTITISFDGGRTFTEAELWYSPRKNVAPILNGGQFAEFNPSDMATAIPLFLI